MIISDRDGPYKPPIVGFVVGVIDIDSWYDVLIAGEGNRSWEVVVPLANHYFSSPLIHTHIPLS